MPSGEGHTAELIGDKVISILRNEKINKFFLSIINEKRIDKDATDFYNCIYLDYLCTMVRLTRKSSQK